MKTAREVVIELGALYSAHFEHGVEEALDEADNMLLAHLRAVVDRLGDWLRHDTDESGFGCRNKCTCGLNAALAEILETKGNEDGTDGN